MPEHVTLLTAVDGGPVERDVSTGLPSDLLGLSAARLQVLALLYALIFFLAGIFPALILPSDRARFLGNVVQWAPGVLGIVVAVALAAVIRRVPPARAMTLGLVFEIVSSYAIAAAEFGDPSGLEVHQGYMGLSWVAVWVVLFTVVGFLSSHGLEDILRRIAGTTSELRLSATAALGANLFDNLPAYLAMEPVASDSPHRMLALLIGVNCGCLLTLWGSLATLLWRARCDTARVDISWWSFLWRGLILTPLVVTGAVFALNG